MESRLNDEYEMLKKLAVEKYELEEQVVKELFYDGLFEIRMKNY